MCSVSGVVLVEHISINLENASCILASRDRRSAANNASHQRCLLQRVCLPSEFCEDAAISLRTRQCGMRKRIMCAGKRSVCACVCVKKERRERRIRGVQHRKQTKRTPSARRAARPVAPSPGTQMQTLSVCFVNRRIACVRVM